MKNILIINSKGGVGKSTLADNLAFSFERTGVPYNFYDLDQQGGVLHDTSENPDAVVSIIDTPGALQDKMGKWITDADVIIIPTMTSVLDIKPLLRMMVLVKNVKCPVYYVLNGWTRYKGTSSFQDFFYDQIRGKKNVKAFALPMSDMVKQAAEHNESVVTYAKRSAVATQMLNIGNAVRQAVGLPEEVM